MNFEIQIEPEMSTTVEQELNFGNLVVNSGKKYVGIQDESSSLQGIGIYNIKLLKAQRVFAELDYPDFLSHINPSINDIIPLKLYLAYSKLGINDPSNAEELINNSGYLYLSSTSEQFLASNIWKQIYIYVSGEIKIGDIKPGKYASEITLKLHYE